MLALTFSNYSDGLPLYVFDTKCSKPSEEMDLCTGLYQRPERENDQHVVYKTEGEPVAQSSYFHICDTVMVLI